jgi:hypothetical protein
MNQTKGAFQMKNISIFMALISVIGFWFSPGSFAQGGMKWRGSGGWGMGSNYNRMYDPKTVETISGEVVSVDIMTPAKGMSYGVHLMLRTDKDTVSIHLGPAWYIENQDITIAPKNRVEVKGSRITFEGKPAIIAAEVKKGDEVLKIRDENGFPFWSGWRRR